MINRGCVVEDTHARGFEDSRENWGAGLPERKAKNRDSRLATSHVSFVGSERSVIRAEPYYLILIALF